MINVHRTLTSVNSSWLRLNKRAIKFNSLFFMYRYNSYRRTYWRNRGVKREYENQTMSLLYNQNLTTTGTAITIVPPTANTLQGKRVAKYFDINFTTDTPPSDTNEPYSFGFLLVYVPEGTTASSVNRATGTNNATTIYEPNQNVIGSGIVNPGGQSRFKVRLGRKLNSGDSIAVILYSPTALREADIVNIFITVNYAIAF